MDTTIGGAAAAGEERLVYSVAEAGALLGISRAFAYELVARGELPVIRLRRHDPMLVGIVLIAAFGGLVDQRRRKWLSEGRIARLLGALTWWCPVWGGALPTYR